MYISEEKNKNLLTIKNDSRITKVGSFLRRFKIDEFPQLVNVLKGDMSFVGPRPEVSKYVNFYPQKSIELIFKVKPGITDMASIKFRNESQMLLDSNDPESYYKNYILPEKIKYYEKYAESNSIFLDILIILKTLLKIFKWFLNNYLIYNFNMSYESRGYSRSKDTWSIGIAYSKDLKNWERLKSKPYLTTGEYC